MFEVEIEQLVSSLPKRIARLGELAYNFWWTWHPEGPKLFQRIHPVMWETVYHNPVKLLRQVPRQALIAAYQDSRYLEVYDHVIEDYTRYVGSFTNGTTPWFPKTHGVWDAPVAYFSFEFGLHESLPMYAGGLGVLAADHLKSASDLGLPMVGVGFLYLQGYFRQRITEDGWQEADYDLLNFAQMPITRVFAADGNPMMIPVELSSRTINVQVWKAQVGRVPLYLLDTDVASNAQPDRQLTYRLYSPDPETRISQEIVLGIGGVRVLRALKVNPKVWHMNEGHPRLWHTRTGAGVGAEREADLCAGAGARAQYDHLHYPHPRAGRKRPVRRLADRPAAQWLLEPTRPDTGPVYGSGGARRQLWHDGAGIAHV